MPFIATLIIESVVTRIVSIDDTIHSGSSGLLQATNAVLPPSWLLYFVMLLEVLVLCLLVAGIQPLSRGVQDAVAPSCRPLQVIAIGYIVLTVVEGSYMVPVAYDLAMTMQGCESNRAAYLSGIIQSTSTFGLFVASFFAMWVDARGSYSLKWWFMVLTPLGTAVSSTCLAWVFVYADSLADRLETVVLTLRFAGGFCSQFTLLLFAGLVREVTPADEQAVYSIWENLAISGGMALGPVVTSLWSQHTVGSRCGQLDPVFHSTCCVAVAFALSALLLGRYVPVSEDAFSAQEKDSETESSPSEVDVGRPVLKMCAGVTAIFAGSFATASIEIGSSLLLEIQYNWSVHAVGLAMGLVFVVSCFFLVVLFKLRTCMRNSYLIALLSLGSVIGVALVFDYGPGGDWKLLAADMVSYAFFTGLNAVVDGMFFMGAPPCISTIGMVAVIYWTELAACSVAPPGVRALIATMGRNAYAFAQVCIVILVTVTALGMNEVINEEVEDIHKQTSDAGFDIQGTTNPEKTKKECLAESILEVCD